MKLVKYDPAKRVEATTCSTGQLVPWIDRLLGAIELWYRQLSLRVGVLQLRCRILLGSYLGFSRVGASGGRTNRYVAEFMICRTKFPLKTILVVISMFSWLGVEKADWNCRCTSHRLSKISDATTAVEPHGGCGRNGKLGDNEAAVT